MPGEIEPENEKRPPSPDKEKGCGTKIGLPCGIRRLPPLFPLVREEAGRQAFFLPPRLQAITFTEVFCNNLRLAGY